MNKKLIISLVCLTLITAVTATAVFYYKSLIPDIRLSNQEIGHHSSDTSGQAISFFIAIPKNPLEIKIISNIISNYNEVAIWNSDFSWDIQSNYSAYNIIGYYDEVDGQTFLTYAGTKTDLDGEVSEVFEQKVFDFVLPLSQNKTNSYFGYVNQK